MRQVSSDVDFNSNPLITPYRIEAKLYQTVCKEGVRHHPASYIDGINP